MGVNSLRKTVTQQLRFKPRPYCTWVQHVNHSATERPSVRLSFVRQHCYAEHKKWPTLITFPWSLTVCVCVFFVGHTCEWYKNSWSDWVSIWGMDLGGTSIPCFKGAHIPLQGTGYVVIWENRRVVIVEFKSLISSREVEIFLIVCYRRADTTCKV